MENDMQWLSMIVGIVVSVCGTIAYLDKNLEKAVHRIVDKLFEQQTGAIEKQNVIFDNLEKTVEKLATLVEKLDGKQQQMVMDFAIMKQSLKAEHERLDNLDERIGRFANFCRCTHEKDAPMPHEVYDAITKRR